MPPDCPHWWLIEPADGPKSRGVCKLCGKEKTFRNSVPEFDHYFDYEKHRQKEIVLDGRALVVS